MSYKLCLLKKRKWSNWLELCEMINNFLHVTKIWNFVLVLSKTWIKLTFDIQKLKVKKKQILSSQIRYSICTFDKIIN